MYASDNDWLRAQARICTYASAHRTACSSCRQTSKLARPQMNLGRSDGIDNNILEMHRNDDELLALTTFGRSSCKNTESCYASSLR